MEVEILCRNNRQILILLLFFGSMMFSMITANEDETVEFYGNEYDQGIEALLGDEDEEKVSFPIRAETEAYSITTTAARKISKCDEDQIMSYLAELRVTNPESILLIASYKDLEHLCRRIAGNLDSIDAFMQTCVPLPQDHFYMQLIAGLRVLSNKLCIQSEYQKVFRKHLSCFHDLHNEYIDCAGPADWIENMEEKELCTQYKIIADCYFTNTAMLCGIKAAKTMKELVVRVINGVIGIHCPELRKNPVVADPMPEFVFSGAAVSSYLISDFKLTLVLLILYTTFIILVQERFYTTFILS